jgi:hypothetical protein
MADESAPRWLKALLLLAIVGGAAALLPAALTAALHCDETNVFRHVTRFQHGDFIRPGRPGLLWLFLLPLNFLADPSDSVHGYRLASVFASLCTLAFVAGIASRPRGDERAPTREGVWGALAAVVLLATSGDWIGHAFEVRTDTYAVPLTLGAIALLWRPSPKRRQLVVAGLLFAAAGLVSQKSVFNVFAIGVGWAVYLLVAARPLRAWARIGHAFFVGGVTAVAMGLWFAILGLLEGKVAAVAQTTVQIGMDTAFRKGVSLDDKLDVLIRCLDKGTWVWALGLASIPTCIALARRMPRSLSAAVVALLMLGTIQVHSGFRVYYVASFEPYIVLAVAGPGGLVLAWLHRRTHAVVPLLLLSLLAYDAHGIAKPFQKKLLATNNTLSNSVLADVADLFPDPVPYWDGLALVPGYYETTFLNTGHARNKLRRIHGKNTYIKLARERKPQFFIRTYMSRDQYMRPAERRWHWTHFVPLRDNLYAAGGRIKVKKGKAAKGDVEILTPGTYKVWFLGGWKGVGKLDGAPVKHGQLVELTAKKHRLEAKPKSGRGELWLILGADREPSLKRSQQQIDWSFFALDWRSRYGHYDRASDGRGDLLTPRHDPTMNDRRWKSRRRRHRDYQKLRFEKTGTP